MKYIVYFLLILNINLYANDNENNSYWNKAMGHTDFLWNKTKELTLNTVDNAKNITTDSVNSSKGALSKWKRILLEQTLVTSINFGLDYNDTIKVNNIIINDLNNSLSFYIKLDGEDKELTLDIKHFDWSITENKEFIILENLDVSLDIAWLDSVLKEYLKRHNGSIKVKYSVGKETFLHSIKANIKTTNDVNSLNSEKEKVQENQKLNAVKELLEQNDENLLENIVKALYDETYIKPIYIQKNGKSIEANFALLGSEKGFIITLEDFDWATANEKTLIAIGNIKFKDCNKPWIESLLKKHHEQILVQYNSVLEELLTQLKLKIQGNIEKE